MKVKYLLTYFYAIFACDHSYCPCAWLTRKNVSPKLECASVVLNPPYWKASHIMVAILISQFMNFYLDSAPPPHEFQTPSYK